MYVCVCIDWVYVMWARMRGVPGVSTWLTLLIKLQTVRDETYRHVLRSEVTNISLQAGAATPAERWGRCQGMARCISRLWHKLQAFLSECYAAATPQLHAWRVKSGGTEVHKYPPAASWGWCRRCRGHKEHTYSIESHSAWWICINMHSCRQAVALIAAITCFLPLS